MKTEIAMMITNTPKYIIFEAGTAQISTELIMHVMKNEIASEMIVLVKFCIVSNLLE